MKYTFVITVLLLVALNCEGQRRSFLDGLISGAQDFGSTVQGAIQGITHGLQNLGNRGKPQRPPQNAEPPTETVLVIVEEDSPSYNPNRPQHHHPGYNYNRPHQQESCHDSNHNHHRPHHHHNHGHHHHGGNGDHGNNGNFGNNGHGNYKPNPRPPHHGSNHNGNNGFPNNNGNYNGNNQGFSETPGTMGIPTAAPGGNINPNGQVTKKPGGDKPHLIPLDPNQYTYGGDNINVQPPKGDTTDKPNTVAGGDDDPYPIDIRFGDSEENGN